MGESDLRLESVTAGEAGLLANLLELYSHDLSEVFPIDVGADGRFGYPQLALYWTEPERRFPFFIKRSNLILGFVLIMLLPCHPERAERVEGPPGKCDGGPSTPLRVARDDTSDDPHVYDIAEFFVLRRYRRSGVGREAAFLAWDRYPGSWTVRVAEGNAGALEFWRRAIDQYAGGTVTEVRRQGDPIAWRVFEFDSRARRRPE
jgi:predicted acetyltransferase